MHFGTAVNTTRWATCFEWWPAGPLSVLCGTRPPWPERKEKMQPSLLIGLSLLLLYKEGWLSSLGIEGWREPRWRTSLRQSHRRSTARWLWAMGISTRKQTECHPGFPELVLRNGMWWSIFLRGGRVVLFYRFCFLLLIFSTQWLSLPLDARGRTHSALFGFCCCYSISLMNCKVVYWIWTDSLL